MAMVAALQAVAGHYRVYTGFPLYDDEGIILSSLQDFFARPAPGRALYSLYGPFFYFWQDAIRTVTGLPLTHDAGRLLTLLTWLVTSVLIGIAVYRATRSPIAGLAAQFLTYANLSDVWAVWAEPGHPQEAYTVVLAGALLFAGLEGPLKVQRLRGLLLGAAAAALFLTKTNLGVLVVLGLAAALVFAGETASRLSRVLRGVFAAGLVALPAALMLDRLRSSADVRHFCLAATLGIAAMLVVTWRARITAVLDSRTASGAAIAAGFLAVAASLLYWFSGVRGIPLRAAFGSLALGVNLYRLSFVPLLLSWTAVLAGVAALAAAIASRLRPPKFFDGVAFPVLKLMLAAGAMFLWHGGAGARLAFLLVTAWLLAADAPFRGVSFFRLFLGWAGLLLALQAYPVAGTQAALAAVPLLAAAVIWAHDGWQGLAARFAILQRPAVPRAAAMAVVFYLCAQSILFAQQQYLQRVPLAMPGAGRIRVEEPEKAFLAFLVPTLREHRDTFLGYYTGNSLYFWTGKPRLLPANPYGWGSLLGAREQRDLIEAAAPHRALALYFYGSEPQPQFEFLGMPFQLAAGWQNLYLAVRSGSALELRDYATPYGGGAGLLLSLSPQSACGCAAITVRDFERRQTVASTQPNAGAPALAVFDDSGMPAALPLGCQAARRLRLPFSVPRTPNLLVRLHDGKGRILASLAVVRVFAGAAKIAGL